MNKLFCFGLGYTALTLAAELLEDGWQVAGTCTSAEKQAALRKVGIAAHLFRRGEATDAAALGGATHVLSSVPPDEFGDPVLDAFAAEFAGRAGAFRWVGYFSTTGVYGDSGGAWVDEASDLSPTGSRGQRRVRAEAEWFMLHSEAGLATHIFRLAGIYGPGRSPLDQVRDGTAHRIDAPGQVFSRIHVDDVVAVLRASMMKPSPWRIYNVCDDEPASPAEVVEFAAQLLRVEPPPLVPLAQAELSEMARSFYADNKRVRNARIKDELDVRLRYPNYRAGLAAVLAAEVGEA